MWQSRLREGAFSLSCPGAACACGLRPPQGAGEGQKLSLGPGGGAAAVTTRGLCDSPGWRRVLCGRSRAAWGGGVASGPNPGQARSGALPGDPPLPARRLEYLQQKLSKATSEEERQALEKQSSKAEREIQDIQ